MNNAPTYELNGLASYVCSVAQSSPTLCHPMGCSPPVFCHGISQARVLEQIAISFSRDLPSPGIEPMSLASPALAGRFFTTSGPLETLFFSVVISSSV